MVPDRTSLSLVAGSDAAPNKTIIKAYAKIDDMIADIILLWYHCIKCLDKYEHLSNRSHTTQRITATGSGVTAMVTLHAAHSFGLLAELASFT